MKGIKNSISKESFRKSTLKGIIRKGFVGWQDIDKTNLTDYSKKAIESYKDKADLLFVRDKNICFLLDTKNKVVFNICDCALQGYFDYFISKNNNYKVVDIEKAHPDNIRARGLAIEKLASDKGFTL